MPYPASNLDSLLRTCSNQSYTCLTSAVANQCLVLKNKDRKPQFCTRHSAAASTFVPPWKLTVWQLKHFQFTSWKYAFLAEISCEYVYGLVNSFQEIFHWGKESVKSCTCTDLMRTCHSIKTTAIHRIWASSKFLLYDCRSKKKQPWECLQWNNGEDEFQSEIQHKYVLRPGLAAEISPKLVLTGPRYQVSKTTAEGGKNNARGYRTKLLNSPAQQQPQIMQGSEKIYTKCRTANMTHTHKKEKNCHKHHQQQCTTIGEAKQTHCTRRQSRNEQLVWPEVPLMVCVPPCVFWQIILKFQLKKSTSAQTCKWKRMK